jgi:hypothetical protein
MVHKRKSTHIASPTSPPPSSSTELKQAEQAEQAEQSKATATATAVVKKKKDVVEKYLSGMQRLLSRALDATVDFEECTPAGRPTVKDILLRGEWMFVKMAVHHHENGEDDVDPERRDNRSCHGKHRCNKKARLAVAVVEEKEEGEVSEQEDEPTCAACSQDVRRIFFVSKDNLNKAWEWFVALHHSSSSSSEPFTGGEADASDASDASDAQLRAFLQMAVLGEIRWNGPF